MLSVRVLGTLRAEVDGATLELPSSSRERALLAWLALHPGLHPRGRVAGVLRPDVPEEAARKALRQAVWTLRRALGPAAGALSAERDRVGLDPDGLWVDAAEFDRLRRAGALEAALAIGDGDLLADLDEEWALTAREEHRAARSRLLGELADRAEADGDLPAAVAWTRRRVEAEPLAEAAARDLMRRLAAAGDRPAALAAYEALAERLRRGLRMAASAETRGLAEEIRRGGGPPPAAAGTPPPPLPPPLAAAGPVVGREDALRRLHSVWGDVLRGSPRVLCVLGEAGIGKTTVARALARRVHAEGALVLYGRSDEEPLVPYQPFVEAVGRHLEALDEAGRQRALAQGEGALARLLPGVGPADPVPLEGAAERYLAFEGVRRLLEEAAAGRPVLLVLDDLHWADRPSLLLLRHLVRGTTGSRVGLLACAREEDGAEGELGAALADLRREGPVVTVRLGGLEQGAVAELVRARGGRAAPGGLARSLHERTGGNPFFVEELLRHLADGDGTDLDEVPPGVRAALSRRLERLGDDAVAVLRVAAVAAPEIELRLVEAVAGGEPDAALDALERACEAGLMVEASPGRYAFSHALVAEALAGSLSAARRARLHARLGAALEEGAAGDPEAHAAAIARHLLAAAPQGDADALGRAARWSAAAGERAAARLAYEEAAEHLERALAALPPGDATRGGILAALGDARDRAGAADAARDAFLAAAEEARGRDEVELLARAALGHGGLATTVLAADAVTQALLEEALERLGSGPAHLRARLLARLAIEVYYGGRPRAEALSAEAVALAREVGEPATLALALNARRVALWSAEHADERLAVASEMVAMAARAGDREATLQGRNWRVLDLLELGRLEEMEAEILTYETAADALGLPHYRWYVPLWRGGLALLRGEWTAAERLAGEALALGRRAGDRNALVLVPVLRLSILQEARRVDEIDMAWIERSMAASPTRGVWLAVVAMLEIERGSRARAAELLDELAADDWALLPRDANWHVICEAAEVCALLGDAGRAARLHEMLLPHARLFPVVARAVCCYGSAEHYLGRLAATAGRTDDAVRHLERGVRANDALGALPRATVGRLHLAELLLTRDAAGDAARARELLADAAAAAESLGLGDLARRARAAAPST
jgi:DNA-binding SARP family transcriptional activator